jgi:hypothetical protein
MLQLQFRLQSPGRVAGRPVNGQFQHGRPPVIATGGRPAESRCEPASLRWWPCRPQLLQARLSVAHQYPCHPIDEWPTILEFGIRRAGKPFGGTEDLSATTEEHVALSQEDFRGACWWEGDIATGIVLQPEPRRPTFRVRDPGGISYRC